MKQPTFILRAGHTQDEQQFLSTVADFVAVKTSKNRKVSTTFNEEVATDSISIT